MNRRGFLTAVCGAATAAAAPIILPKRPVADKPVTPVSAPVLTPPAPAPVPTIETPLKAHARIALERVEELIGKVRIYDLDDNYPRCMRVGWTSLAREGSPFTTSTFPVTLDRMSTRGHTRGWKLGDDGARRRALRCADEIAYDILLQHEAGACGLLFGALPDPVGLNSGETEIVSSRRVSLRATRAYDVFRDLVLIRIDCLYGWRYPTTYIGAGGNAFLNIYEADLPA